MTFRTVTSKRRWRAVALGTVVVAAIWSAVLMTAALGWWAGALPRSWRSDDKIMAVAFLWSTMVGGFVMRRRVRWTGWRDAALAAGCAIGICHALLLMVSSSLGAWVAMAIGFVFGLVAVPFGAIGATLANVLPSQPRG